MTINSINRHWRGIWAFILIIAIIALLSSCTFTKDNAAPISDLRNKQAIQRGYHTVTRGETLYLIAWRYGKDFRELASINHLTPPYSLTVGDKIYLKGKTQYYPYKPKTKKRVKTSVTTKSKLTYKAPIFKAIHRWLMPARGTIIKKYSYANKGINIAGSLGEPVRAVAAGEVVYAGSGLRSYGNLLIIKHNDVYLSAYAHNRKLLVKQGQFVKIGQEIAQMGSTGTNRVMLHFELRKRGKPVNPLKYIRWSQ